MKTSIKTYLYVAGLVMPVVVLAAASPRSASPASRSGVYAAGCLPADRIPTSIQAELIRLMARTDDLSNKVLASWGVARVPTNQISIISDTTACRRASNAYSAAMQLAPEDRLVYTVHAGIRYLVIDPTITAGEWKRGVTFDSSFTQVVARFGY